MEIVSSVLSLVVVAVVVYIKYANDKQMLLNLAIEALNRLASAVSHQVSDDEIREIAGEVYDGFKGTLVGFFISRDAFCELCVEVVRRQSMVNAKAITLVRGQK